MADKKIFTGEEIAEIMKLLDATRRTQYIGARYVPIFGRKGEASIEWDNSAPYEPLTIVLYKGNSFTSRQYVPTGVDINDENFWAQTGLYNAQVEAYRQDVVNMGRRVTQAEGDIKDNTDAIRALIGDNTVDNATNAKVKWDKASTDATNAVNDTEWLLDNSCVIFKNVNELKNSTKLTVDSKVATQGFYEADDNGGAMYLITDNATPNDITTFALQNNLFATLINTNNVHVRQLGAKENIDCTNVLQFAVDNFDTVVVDNGTYETGLVTVRRTVNIIGSGYKTSTLAPQNNETVLLDFYKNADKSTLKNIHIQSGIVIGKNSTSGAIAQDQDMTVDNVFCTNGLGIEVYSRGNFIVNSHITRSDHGVFLKTTDCSVMNCVAANCNKSGFYAVYGENYISNCKAFMCGKSKENHDNSGFLVEKNDNVLTTCVAQQNYMWNFTITGDHHTVSACMSGNAFADDTADTIDEKTTYDYRGSFQVDKGHVLLDCSDSDIYVNIRNYTLTTGYVDTTKAIIAFIKRNSFNFNNININTTSKQKCLIVSSSGGDTSNVINVVCNRNVLKINGSEIGNTKVIPVTIIGEADVPQTMNLFTHNAPTNARVRITVFGGNYPGVSLDDYSTAVLSIKKGADVVQTVDLTTSNAADTVIVNSGVFSIELAVTPKANMQRSLTFLINYDY